MSTKKIDDIISVVFVSISAIVLFIFLMLFFQGTLTLNFISSVLSIYIAVGIIITLVLIIKDKKTKMLLISVLFPPYIIRYVLDMQESALKKVLSIQVMGCLVVFFLINILKIIMTPQM